MKYLTKVGTILEHSTSYGFTIAGVLLVAIMLLTVAEVIMRPFGRSMGWAFEISETLLLFITFLGAAWLVKKDKHVTIDLITDRLKPSNRLIVASITHFISAIVCFVLFWYGVQVTWMHFQESLVTHKMLEIPLAAILCVIPVGSFLLFIALMRRSHALLKTRIDTSKQE